MLRCRLRFFQRLICLVIIVMGAALIVSYRYHEVGVLRSNELLQTILNKDNEISEVTSNKPASNPVVSYKRRVSQSTANNEIKTLSVTSLWRVWRTWPHSAHDNSSNSEV